MTWSTENKDDITSCAIRCNGRALQEDYRWELLEEYIWKLTRLEQKATALHNGLPNSNTWDYRRDSSYNSLRESYDYLAICCLDDHWGDAIRRRIKEDFLDIDEYARQHIEITSDRMKVQYDLEASQVNTWLPGGDKVKVYRPRKKIEKFTKLQQQWGGPYTVLDRTNEVVY